MMTQGEQADFHCCFDDINYYPFDTQTCYFVIMSDTPLLAGELIVNPYARVGMEFGHYRISNWSMQNKIDGNL